MNAAPPRPEWDLLLSAAQKNNVDQIRQLLADGVDPSHANGVGQSALHIAALWGNVEAVEALIAAGANVNARNRIMGSSPLHMAAQSNKASLERQLQTIDCLLKAGANLQETDLNGANPYDYAKNREVKDKTQPRVPTIYQAIEEGDLNRLHSLLATRSDTFDLNGSHHERKTLFDWSVEKLLQAMDDGRDVSDLATMIHQLVSEGAASNQESTYVLLVALQEKYKQPESQQSTAYLDILQSLVVLSLAHQREGPGLADDACLLAHQAARHGLLPMLQFMVEQLGMDPNVGNRQKMTALHFAARSGQVHVVQYLLSLNAATAGRVNVIARDSLGQTPLDAARINYKKDVVALLQDVTYGAEPATE